MRDQQEFPVDDPFNESVSATDNCHVRRWIGIVPGKNAKEHALRPVDAQFLMRRTLGWNQHVLGGQITDDSPTGCHNSLIWRRIERSTAESYMSSTYIVRRPNG